MIPRPLPALLSLLFVLFAAAANAATDPLPAWQDGANKRAIIAFVERVTNPEGDGFVAPAERIATFDNDGTLWAEQPLYFQALYALDRIRAMAPEHPEWQEDAAFRAAIDGDVAKLMATGKDNALKVLLTAHAGMSAEAFAASVADWLATARHPTTGLPYTRMIYQPMLELMDYLRANDFRVFIVSGGGIDFLRVFSEEVYGIPPEQVVGTTTEARLEMRDGIPTIIKEGGISLVDDKAGKPVGIYRHIGRRPLLAGGNSDGDLQMLQYTTIARGDDDTTPRLGVIVHHTDGEREFAYDRESAIGKLDRAMDEAAARGWLLIDMKKDWRQVYPDAP